MQGIQISAPTTLLSGTSMLLSAIASVSGLEAVMENQIDLTQKRTASWHAFSQKVLVCSRTWMLKRNALAFKVISNNDIAQLETRRF